MSPLADVVLVVVAVQGGVVLGGWLSSYSRTNSINPLRPWDRHRSTPNWEKFSSLEISPPFHRLTARLGGISSSWKHHNRKEEKRKWKDWGTFFEFWIWTQWLRGFKLILLQGQTLNTQILKALVPNLVFFFISRWSAHKVSAFFKWNLEMILCILSL